MPPRQRPQNPAAAAAAAGGAAAAQQHHQQRPSWFQGAPATKIMVMLTVLSYVVLHKRKTLTSYAMDSTKVDTEPGRYFTSKLTFGGGGVGELVTGTLLLAFLARKFEREMGSIRFIAFYFYVNLVTVAMEMCWINTVVAPWPQRRLAYMDDTRSSGRCLPCFITIRQGNIPTLLPLPLVII